MGDSENALPPSKKRAAGREISKDNPGLDDDEDLSEMEAGTFKKASDEVLATRRIVKVRRSQSTAASSVPKAPVSNPFAGIRLVSPSDPTAAPQPGTTGVTSYEKVPSDIKDDACNVTEESKKDADKKHGKSSLSESVVEAATEKENTENKVNAATVSEGAEPIEHPEKPLEDKAENNEVGEAIKSVDENAKGGDGCEDKDEDVTRSDKAEDVDNSKTVEDTKAEDDEKKDKSSGSADPGAEGTALNSFQQLSSSRNAFTGLAGTGFSSSSFSFGSIPTDGSFGKGAGPLFGQKSDQPSFGFGLSTNGNSSLFNASGSTVGAKSEGSSSFPSMPEVPVETGEENERAVFSADSVLFEFLDGSWKERGKGEVKVNVPTGGTEKARLLMRSKGNLRLILNANLYSDIKLTNMDKRGITFACINSVGEGQEALSTFALKFRDGSIVEDFRAAVMQHKDHNTSAVLKTPENSP
ncbi:Nuclear pore complex protein NUP50B [Linum perenne]